VIDIWLYGTHVARVDVSRGGRLRLSYVKAAIDRWGLGSRILTVASPISKAPLSPGPTKVIVDGLLPEGATLDILKAEFGVRYPAELLRILGGETVGAVVALPDDEQMPSDASEETPRLAEADVAVRLRALPNAPLGVALATKVRLSLAGAQPKLPLTRDTGGTLHDPTFAKPSTVILKPEPPGWPRLVELEAYGLAVMRAAGVPTPEFRQTQFDGISVLEVDRYDRVTSTDGAVDRRHQEDLCMAVGARPSDKYATLERSPTALIRLARVVYDNSVKPEEDLAKFVRALIVNVAVGNCDAHARNLSIIHNDDDSIMLAPVYDVVPTYHYLNHERHLAQPIDRNVFRPEIVSRKHLEAELDSWKIPNINAVLGESLEAVEAAISAVTPPESAELEKLFAKSRLFE